MKVNISKNYFWIRTLLIFCLFFALMINAYGQEHRLGLEVLEITEELDRSDRIIYKGSVINLGKRIVRFPQIIMTLKLDGKVVAIKMGYLVGSSEDYNLIPGGVGSFEIRTYLKSDEFDAYAVTFEGRLGTLWSEFVTGSPRVLEQTLNWGNDSLDRFLILGEFINETNAVLTNVSFTFYLLDSEDKIIGNAEAHFYVRNEIFPGELISFRARSNIAIAVDKVARWETVWEYTADRIPQDYATIVEQVSWGNVKASFDAE